MDVSLSTANAHAAFDRKCLTGAIRVASLLGLMLPWSGPNSIALAAQEHGGHAGFTGRNAAVQQPSGAPYLLDVDPVSGKSLGPVERQVVVRREGREFRFANQRNADAFAAAPGEYVPGVDAKLIEQQTRFYPLDVCVVSGAKLDDQDVLDFVHLNRLVRVSRPEHEATFLADPAAYVAKLDAAVIERQMAQYPLATCVVSGERLGEAGDPIDRVIGNRLVRFCCKDCLAIFDKDPPKYLAKLDGGSAVKVARVNSDRAARYACPTHADVVKNKAGRCPTCGMDLVKQK